jgi:hypothetical protein
MRGVKYDDKFLLLLWGKIQYFQRHYIFPSQKTILIWLRNQGGLDVSRRTLNRYLRNLQNRQIIGRIRRVSHDPIKGMQFASTLYSIGFLGLRKLVMLGVITYEQMREYIKNSKPFRSRQQKKSKKGITPGMPGFYNIISSLGDLIKSPY